MTKKSPDGPVADLYAAACKIADGTRKVFEEHGKDAREVRLPILMRGTDMRVTIEAGPKIAARNAVEHAQMSASGKPAEPTVDMTAVLNDAKALLAAYASELHDRIESSDPDPYQTDERTIQRCLAVTKGLFEVERLV